MNWLIVMWSMAASACLTLALIYFLIWARDGWNRVHLLFAVTAIGVAGIAAGELGMMLAQTPEEFATRLRWVHIPLFVTVVSLVWFVRSYFGTGRHWLAGAYTTLRALILVINFTVATNFNYSQITGLRHVAVIGNATAAVPVGTVSSRGRLGEFSSLLLVTFVVDASVSLWRRGGRADRRRAIVLGGSMFLFALAAAGHVALIHAGLIHLPYMISLAFLLPVAAMAYELVGDVVRAARLARELEASRAELSDTQERMELAASAAGLAMWRWDIEGDEIWLSEQGRALFGLSSPGSISFDRFMKTLHPEDRQNVIHAVANSMNGDGDYQSEFRVVMPDGRLRWIGGRGRVEFNGRGKPVRVRGASIDISERKDAEESLRESETRFREVANAAPVMIWMSGGDKLCTFFNKPWLEFTGRTMEQELGNGWAQGVHPDDYERCLEVYTTAFDARQEFMMEYRLRTAHGGYRFVLDNGVPRFAPDGAFRGYIGSAIDITERKRSEELVRQVVEGAPNAMIVINSKGIISLVNLQTEAVFGYARGELIDQPVEMLIPGGINAAPHPRAMGAGRSVAGRRKDGSEIPVEIGVNSIQTPEGSFTLASIIDITERRTAEREQVRNRNELAHLARVAILGELSGSLAHELNQPLTAILSNAQAAQEFLRQEPVDLDEVREVLNDIVEEDRRAREVIRRLRLLFRKGELPFEALDLNDIVAEVLKLMNSDLINHGVTVQTELATGLPRFRGDRVQLQQVMINLIVNASDAMNGNGPGERNLCIGTGVDENRRVRLSVADSGYGIAPAQLQEIFEPFHTTKANGMGLGLAVCRTIMSAHAGEIWVDGNHHRGACFHVAFPSLSGASDEHARANRLCRGR